MGKLTCPKCQQKTSHISLEYMAQTLQVGHGKKIKNYRIQRVGECVKCLDCRLTYISTEEGKEHKQ